MYEDILKFNGNWRTYQQRVLNHFDRYKKDGKIHIVAAPGSGKTTLGIELIKRFDEPAIIFVPTITIREQWANRIKEAFLLDGINSDDYLSQDLKHLKLINIATYQSLHSAMIKYQGVLTEDNEMKYEEVVDYNDYDLVDEIQKAHVRTLCLDECHHLRNEWWKSLETFKEGSHIKNTISLTATPPYDSNKSMWDRYIAMCGEIDEEITVPELVKEGSLCPHQDYVYFNYPTKKEEQEIEVFKKNSEAIVNQLLNDQEFQKVIQSHRYLYQRVDYDQLLENPAYLSSILIYLEEKGLSYPSYFQQLLGYRKLEKMSVKWMEILLQGVLYDDSDSYTMTKQYHEYLLKELKSRGLIENRKVTLQVNQAIEKMLIKSNGKCESIKTIVFHEYENMKNQLKLLILTDYIKKEYEKAIGNVDMDVTQLGVIPFFEMLRRENINRNEDIKLGVLCGSIIIIPSVAKERLLEIVNDIDRIYFSNIGVDDYLEVKVRGEAHFIINLITQLFEEGYMHVLIGTKSLLGEGWDSPSVNTLILASFVGSFMLSNQMRGRAIRTNAKDPLKASHIWHLVCINPKEEDLRNSEDFETLSRRMEHFLGLHYNENYIENGINRLTAIHYPLSKNNIKKTNEEMLELSSHRDQLKQRWDDSLVIFDKIDVVDENTINDKYISLVLFHDAIRKYIVLTICTVIAFVLGLIALSGGIICYIYCSIVLLIYLLTGAFCIKKIFVYKNPLGRLQVFGEGIYHALKQMNLLESYDSCVKVENEAMNHMIYLAGGTGHDKQLFANCISQFFDEIDNQRYILYAYDKRDKMDGYFVVPDVFNKRKEDAQLFCDYVKPFIGNYDLVYTRSEGGRKILLQGRIKALANKEERCISRKRVKGALE